MKPVNARVSVVGNVLYYGANTVAGLALLSPKGDAYMEDNLAFDRDGKPAPLTGGQINILPEKPAWPAGLKALAASEAVDHVVKHAGARPKDRDDVDRRIIRDFEQRQGRFIDSQRDVGGYPQVKPVTRKLAVPGKDVEGWLHKLAAELE